MQGKLFFAMNLNYNQTLNEQLKKLSAIKKWDFGFKTYLYFFPIESKKQVETLTNEEIKIKGIPEYTSEEVILDSWKGKSTIDVVLKNDAFLVKTYQKRNKGEQSKPMTFTIMKSVVVSAWEVVKEMKKYENYTPEYVSMKICKRLNLDRFFEKGNFKWNSFFGTRKISEGQIYFTHYYYPLKILQDAGVLEHTRVIRRIKDNWELQGELY